MADDIPAWAKERASILFDGEDRTNWSGDQWRNAFARYIAAHEQAPDPLVEAIQVVWDYAISCEHMPSIRAHQLRAELARRGLTITASDATASVQSPERVDAAPGRKG